MFATSSNSEIQTYGIEFILLNHAVYTYICIYIVCVCVCQENCTHRTDKNLLTKLRPACMKGTAIFKLAYTYTDMG